MAKGRIIDRIMAALLGALAALGGMGVLASGMRFEEISVISLLPLFVISCLVIAFLAGRKLFPIIPVLMVGGCIYLWWTGTLEPALEAFLHQMSKLYDMGYHWGVIRWTEIPINQGNAAVIFAVLGLWIGLTVTWTAVRGRCAWLAVFAAFAPLIPCMVLTDTVPGAGFLFIQLLCILLLLLSQMVRKRNLRQGGTLLMLLVLPITLALGALFLLMPQENYQGQMYAQKIEDFFLELLQIAPEPEVPPTVPVTQTETAERVHLTTVGPKAVRLTPVMTVSAEETALMYLRGTAYDAYRGTTWDEDAVDYRFSFYSHGAAYKRATVTTYNIHDVLFTPYAPQTIMADGDVIAHNIMGRIDNENALQEYTITYSPVTDLEALKRPPDIVNGTLIYHRGEFFNMQTGQVATSPADRYLRLPDATLGAARALLAQELPELDSLESQWEQTQAIVAYVRQSASYDLNTRAMPRGEEDFALWFLKESDTGYCVHFATATTVLLRAANIPARYVTGYMTWTRAGETVTVQQKNAHAWTEVYIPGCGWVVVDATPPAGVDQTAGTEPTDPEETTAPTAPIVPDASTETTIPEETTEETQPEVTTVPSQNGDDSNNSGDPDTQTDREPFVLPQWAKDLLWLSAAVAMVVGQWKIRVKLRKRRQSRGTNNARALAMWRDVEILARLLHTEPEEELLELAWKARFSQHCLTPKEVFTMEVGMGSLRRDWRRSAWWKRLFGRLILALE